MISDEPGWVGMFTREQVPGAYPNETRVVKVLTERGDTMPLGTCGTVLGSIDGTLVENISDNGKRAWVFYFVEWDTLPRAAVGVVDWKILRGDRDDAAEA